MRGRRPRRLRAACPARSIPAGAGPTTRRSTPPSTRREHPRGCGADGQEPLVGAGRPGASPRVRGRPRPKPGRSPRDPEHPRACGADEWQEPGKGPGRGASPRVRGRRRHRVLDDVSQRSIPARAGPTASPPTSWTPTAEHPRACGADGPDCRAGVLGLGASPRVRGRRWLHLCSRPPKRSIPAGAGPTSRAWQNWGTP